MFVSLAVPAGVLALIANHHSRGNPAANATSTTEVSPTDTTKARVGTAAPNFSLRSTSGRTVTLASLRGRPVVIAFFASWCQPCQEELPVLQQFEHDDAGRLTVVGVNYQDLPSDTAAFVKRLHVTFPALLEDPSGPVADRYGVRGIPQTVFVGGARDRARARLRADESQRSRARDRRLARRPRHPADLTAAHSSQRNQQRRRRAAPRLPTRGAPAVAPVGNAWVESTDRTVSESAAAGSALATACTAPGSFASG